jgi:MoaA/NifB/PqqE/SkfB family radical SAM enzyme
LEGIRAAASFGVAPSIRVTLQRANYRQLPMFVDLARAVGARQVSFLAVDVANPHAFGRVDDFSSDLALRVEDLPVFEGLVRSMEVEYAESFRSGFIAESPLKLRRILQYFSAVCGREAFPPVRCNAPEFSAVIGANGRVQPCFFIPGPPGAEAWDDFGAALDSDGMAALRDEIRAGKRPECGSCVCSMWRELDTVACSVSVSHAAGLSI